MAGKFWQKKAGNRLKLVLFHLKFLSYSSVAAISLVSLVACGEVVNAKSKIDGFREKAKFVKTGNELKVLTKNKFNIVLFGNSIKPYLNVNNFFKLKDEKGKDFADYLEGFFKMVSPQRLESFTKDFSQENIDYFINLLKDESVIKTGEDNLSHRLSKASTIIISLGLKDVFKVIFNDLKGYDYVNLIFESDPANLFRSKINGLRARINSEILRIKNEYQTLIRMVKQLNPEADIILLGFPFVQLTYLDSVISGILSKFFDINVSDGILNEALSALNGEILNLATEEDIEFVSFNSRNFFEIKEPLLDSAYSFFSIKLVMLAQERIAKLIFLKLATPVGIMEKLRLLLPDSNVAKTVEETKEFNLLSRELRADWLSWLSTRESEDEDLGNYYKGFYFSEDEEKKIVERIAQDESLANSQIPEDNYKDKRFYQTLVNDLVMSFFDQETANKFLDNNKELLNNVSISISNFFVNSFEDYKSSLKWVDLVKIIEIFVSFYKALITRVTPETKERVVSLFKELISRINIDLKADFKDLKLETFSKYKDILNNFLSILIEKHKILEETISKYLFIKLKPGQILNLLTNIREGVSQKDEHQEG